MAQRAVLSRPVTRRRPRVGHARGGTGAVGASPAAQLVRDVDGVRVAGRRAREFQASSSSSSSSFSSSSSLSSSVKASAAASSTSSVASEPAYEMDRRGKERLVYEPEGYNFVRTTEIEFSTDEDAAAFGGARGISYHYVAAGLDSDGEAAATKPTLVLLHGFGASCYHFRYNIPVLAKHFRVFAPCLLGFGWSDKPIVDYSSGKVWASQLRHFLREVVGSEAVVAGNSMGGLATLFAAADARNDVKGIVLLNAAGRLRAEMKSQPDEAFGADKQETDESNIFQEALDTLAAGFRRLVLGATFLYSKQPSRVEQVLRQVYYRDENIDDELIESILRPSREPAAEEVFCKVVDRTLASNQTIDDLLLQADRPTLLLWGSKDPWIVPKKADYIMGVKPDAERVDLLSGHCPHDDTPDEVNAELVKWVHKIW